MWDTGKLQQLDTKPTAEFSQKKTSGGHFLCRVGGFDCYVVGDLADAEAAWEMLESRSAISSPFQKFAWMKVCAQLCDGAAVGSPVIVVGYSGDEPKFIIPLAIKHQFGCRSLIWLAGHLNDYNGIVIDQDTADAVDGHLLTKILDAIIIAFSPIDAVVLTRFPEDGHPSVVRPSGLAFEAGSSGTHLLGLKRNWKELYSELRSAKSRQRLRGKLNALRKKGRITFRRIRNGEERERVAMQILNWKSSQLDDAGSQNPFGNVAPGVSPQSELSGAVLKAANSQYGATATFGLFVDDSLVAGMIAFIDEITFSLFITAYDPEKYRQCSPGAILLLRTLELSARAGLQHYDFLLGDEPYKFEWSNRHLAVSHHMRPITVKGIIFVRLARAGLNLKIWIKARPRLLGLLKQANRYRSSKKSILTEAIQSGQIQARNSSTDDGPAPMITGPIK